jgi:rod shape-determining protein MreC
VVDFRDGSRRGRRREALIAGAVVLVAVVLSLLPLDYQKPIRDAIRGSVLRPFIALQTEIAQRRKPGVNVGELQAQRDSLLALVSAQTSLSEENRRLRSLLGLSSRAQPGFIPAELIRVNTSTGESTFIVSVGTADSIGPGSPVIAANGLVGVVWESEAHRSQGIDWTHPEFRASAMTASGDAYGIVEPRRGRFREEDQLALTGAPFHSDIRAGTRIVTSGRGGIFPRGIPLATVLGIEEADTGWRKSYLLRPAVRPEGLTHVLVGVRSKARRTDLSALWNVEAPADPALLSKDSLRVLAAADSSWRVFLTDSARAAGGVQ